MLVQVDVACYLSKMVYIIVLPDTDSNMLYNNYYYKK